MRENKTKIDNIILHFANAGMLHLGLKKLAKLMYFVDFTSQELLDQPITGMKYEKRQYGPMPSPVSYYGHLDRLESMGLIKIAPLSKSRVPKSINALQKPDYSVFSDEEKKIIDDVTEQFRHSTASTVERIAQSEPPYKMVRDREEIPYHLAYYRNSFDEMTLDDENTDSQERRG